MGTLVLQGVFHPKKTMFSKHWASPIELYADTNCLATEILSVLHPMRKSREKGGRRCVPEQWVWAVPSSVMNTPRRTGSNGSCQNPFSSFEVSSKGPAQDTRSKARTGVGISLLVCLQWDCKWEAMCVCARRVHGTAHSTITKPQSALKW